MKEKRTYSDRAEYLKKAVVKRRRKIKLMAVEYMGGQCSKCGYKKCVAALEFHHKDINKKDFGISINGATRSWEKTKVELDKCIMLCSNCHRELHEELKELNLASIGSEGLLPNPK